MRCLIVDDDKVQRELIAGFVRETHSLTLSGSCESAVKAANILNEIAIDLILLDIAMPIMSGLEFLRHVDVNAQIILITSKEQHALEAFEYDVTDYLLKPVSYSRFLKAISKARNQPGNFNHTRSAANEIFVKANSVLEKIKLTDVLLIEAAVDYVLIRTADSKYMVNSSLSSILNKLPKKDFVRVHRSYVVRIDKIDSIDGNTVVVNDQFIKIGRSYRKGFMQRISPI